MHSNDKSKEQSAILDLNNRCKVVEEAILHVNACKQQIDDYTKKVKLEVRETVSCMLDHIRQRELQLLRQVEVIQSHYGNMYHTQNAKLHQILGTLQHALNFAEGQCTELISHDDLQFIEEVRKQKLLPNSISFQGNVEEFYKQVERFGTLTTTSGFFPWHSCDDVKSTSLPSKLEEYEDIEYLLFKSLNDLQLKEENHFEANTRSSQYSTNDWLKPCLMNMHQKNTFSLPNCFVMEDVSFWLKEGLRESIMEEISDDDKTSFEIVDDERNSDSDEFLANKFNDSLDVDSHFLKNGCKDHQNCLSGSPMDIENLGNVLCGTGNMSCHEYVNRWLAKKTDNASMGTLPDYHLKVGDICVANECCADFGECICKDRCVPKAIQILNSQMSEPSNWLKMPQAYNHNWLKKSKHSSIDEKIDLSEKNEEINGDCHKWAKTASNCSTSSLNCTTKGIPAWVNPVLPNSMPSNFPVTVRRDFECYFNSNDAHVWLND